VKTGHNTVSARGCPAYEKRQLLPRHASAQPMERDGWGETKMEVPAGVDAPWTEEGE
jgi:hypothetical protein